VNIRDLAEHLNVSIGTVSRALNARTGVSADTRLRVMEAAKRLNYVPNQSGRSLRQGATGIIAAMIPTSEAKPLADTIFMGVLEGLRKYLDERRLDLMVLLSGPGDEAFAYLQRTVRRGLVDGLLISDTLRDDPRIDYLLDRQIPFVAFGRSRSGVDYPWIDLDFEGVARRAVARFVERGHQRIAVAQRADEINYPYILVEAFRAALSEHNLPVDPRLIIRAPGSEEGGYQLGQTIMSMTVRPTAVILTDDSMSVGLYRSLIDAGLMPGRDLAIVGLQETPSSRFLSPKLTGFYADYSALGAKLGEALIARMSGVDASAPKTVTRSVWPMELSPGESDSFGPSR